MISELDKQSPVWRKVSDHLLQRLEYLRYQLEADKTFEETMLLRGHIAEIRAMLKLGEAPIKFEE